METKNNTPRRDLLCELGLEESIVLEDPSFDAAIIGYDDNTSRIIYDYDKMVKCLMDEDGLSFEDAEEFIDFNTIRAIPYMPNGPIIMHGIEDCLD